jgi:hypothetical protein
MLRSVLMRIIADICLFAGKTVLRKNITRSNVSTPSYTYNVRPAATEKKNGNLSDLS